MSPALWQAITDLVFPKRCVGCGRLGALLCPPCLRKAPLVLPPFCQKCGRPLGPVSEKGTVHTATLCLSCRETPMDIAGIRSPYVFTGVIRKSIHAFKYNGISSLAPTLGHLLAGYVETRHMVADVVVPVPLHPRRRKERGYDQAELLARRLAEELGLPLGKDWLVRRRHTLPQVSTTSAAQRKSNVQGAFAASSGVEPGRAVLLVDDVCTTGATLEACAQALRQAGAPAIWGLTVAREA